MTTTGGDHDTTATTEHRVDNRHTMGLDENFRAEQYNLLESIAIREGFHDYEIEQTLIPCTGQNFLGILYEVTIKGRRVELPEELRLFVKIATPSEGLRQLLPLHDVYCNEFFVYKTLSKLYNNWQEEALIPDTERYTFAPFFGSLENDYTETIVLDNLTHKGYTVQNRFESITLEYAQIAINNLAKFHALSYIFERRDPGQFDEIVKIKINLLREQKTQDLLRETSASFIQNAVAQVKNPMYVDKVRRFCEKMCEDLGQYFKDNKHPVLCHGDYRVNNILVKYEKDKITSLIPVDYQLIYYGSPVNDLFYFLFSATDQALRRNHFSYLLKHYYQCLGGSLKAFGCDVEEVYPRSAYDSDLDTHRMYGMVMAAHTLQFMLVPEADAPSMKKLGEDKNFLENMSKSVSDVFKQRFNGIIDDFVEWGYL